MHRLHSTHVLFPRWTQEKCMPCTLLYVTKKAPQKCKMQKQITHREKSLISLLMFTWLSSAIQLEAMVKMTMARWARETNQERVGKPANLQWQASRLCEGWDPCGRAAFAKGSFRPLSLNISNLGPHYWKHAKIAHVLNLSHISTTFNTKVWGENLTLDFDIKGLWRKLLCYAEEGSITSHARIASNFSSKLLLIEY